MAEEKEHVTLGEAKLITGEKDSTVLREKLAAEGVDVPLRGRGTAIPVATLKKLGYKVDFSKLTETPKVDVDDRVLRAIDNKISKTSAKLDNLKAELASLMAERKVRYKELTSVKAKAVSKAARLKERAEKLLAEAAALEAVE